MTDRPLALPSIVPVAGVSYRQDTVNTCRTGQQVTVVADPSNPHDANAHAVIDDHGRLLGYIPSALTGRVAAHGQALEGRIHEIVGQETTGLRIELTATCDGERVTTPSSSDDALSISDRTDADGASGPAAAAGSPDPQDANGAAARQVMSRSGRAIGRYAGEDGMHVLVDVGERTVRYPAKAVRVVDTEAANV